MKLPAEYSAGENLIYPAPEENEANAQTGRVCVWVCVEGMLQAETDWLLNPIRIDLTEVQNNVW